MAKAFTGKQAKDEDYPYPSRYGSHSSMVNEVETEALKDKSQVVMTDDKGTYRTLRKRLDNGAADPNRYCGRAENI